MNQADKYLFRIYSRCIPVIIMIILSSVVLAVVNPAFLTVQNFLNLLDKAAALQWMACGMTLVLLGGQIDLSGVSVMIFSGILGMMLMPGAAGIPLIMLIGILIGQVNGLLISRLRMPSLFTTLAMAMILDGLSVRLSQGQAIIAEESIRFFGIVPGPGMFSVSALIVLPVMIALEVILRKTVGGYYIRAVGENEETAQAAGIRTNVVTVILFAAAGLFYSIGSISQIGRMGLISTSVANDREYMVLAGIVIGGCSLSGGKGSFLGAYLGVFFFCILENAFNLLEISSDWNRFFQGMIIMYAIVAAVIPGWWKEERGK